MAASKTQKTASWLTAATLCIGAAEGCLTYVYKDPLGIPTYCYGETQGARMGDKYTQEQCDALLVKRVLEFDEKVVQRCVGRDIVLGLPPETRAAIVSFAYNVGPGGKGVKDGFCQLKNGNTPTITRYLREGKFVEACNQLPQWANPAWLRGLKIRRDKEQTMCLEGLGLKPTKVTYGTGIPGLGLL